VTVRFRKVLILAVALSLMVLTFGIGISVGYTKITLDAGHLAPGEVRG
jgi:hypothetical protein